MYYHNVYHHYTLNLYNIKDVISMQNCFIAELNPYEQAIQFCKQKIKDALAAHLPKLAAEWKLELDRWSENYRKYLLATSR